MEKLRFIDLFAGAGGLSEGFIRAGFTPVAHVESDTAACCTLVTRIAYHWLKEQGRIEEYYQYLRGEISRNKLYQLIPISDVASVINKKIGEDSLSAIFSQIDSLREEKPIDLIIGGPPCQAYSLVGRARDNNSMQGDKRNYLYIYYAEFLKRYNPRVFIFENVIGLLSAKPEKGEPYFNSMRELFREAGYETEFRILTASDYGVLQSRKRIILMGRKTVDAGVFPEPMKWEPCSMVNEVLDDLPSLQAGEGNVEPCIMKEYNGSYLYDVGIRNDSIPVTWHIARPHTKQDLEIYTIAVRKWNKNKERLDYNDLPEHLKTHKNRESFKDRFKVVAANLSCSHTVVAHISKDGHYYIHPDIKQNRSLTPREAARLQTFPDDYFFEGVTEMHSRTAAFQQIGNAVPVLLSQKIAEKLREIW